MDKSGPICGALVNGVVKPCPSMYAKYEGPRTSSCPVGSDPGLGGGCYACPPGMERNDFLLATSGHACGVGSERQARVHEGHDARAACARTSHSTIRSVAGSAGAARGITFAHRPAWRRRVPVSPSSDRRSCAPRPRWSRSASANRARSRSCSATTQCWTCPEGTHRTVFTADSDKACVRVGNRRFAPAVLTGSTVCASGQKYNFLGVSEDDLAKMRKRAAEAKDEAGSRVCGAPGHQGGLQPGDVLVLPGGLWPLRRRSTRPTPARRLGCSGTPRRTKRWDCSI